MIKRIDKDDGVKYINIYSQSKTELGRRLSNFFPCRITLERKTFYSVEAYWYWLACQDHPDRDKLCKLSGWKAKSEGRELLKTVSNTEWDVSKLKIIRAIRKKIINDNQLLNMLKESNLPFTHHYVYCDKIIKVKNCDWMINYIDKFRSKLKQYE